MKGIVGRRNIPFTSHSHTVTHTHTPPNLLNHISHHMTMKQQHSATLMPNPAAFSAPQTAMRLGLGFTMKLARAAWDTPQTAAQQNMNMNMKVRG